MKVFLVYIYLETTVIVTPRSATYLLYNKLAYNRSSDQDCYGQEQINFALSVAFIFLIYTIFI